MFDLGLNLRTLRIKKKWTQKRLANMMNLSESAICKYESNLSVPSIEVLRSYSSIFNVSLDELLGMERGEVLSLNGLTNEQTAILRELSEIFNDKDTDKNVYEIIGKVAVEISKKI